MLHIFKGPSKSSGGVLSVLSVTITIADKVDVNRECK